MKKIRVEIDGQICQGFGACVELCSGTFLLSEEDGKSRLRGGEARTAEDGGITYRVDVEELGCYG